MEIQERISTRECELRESGEAYGTGERFCRAFLWMELEDTELNER